MLGFGEAHVLPGAPGIGGFVDAVAVGDVKPDGGFAHPGIDHIGVGAGDRDGADGGGFEEAIRDVAPIDAAILGLPDAACAGAEIERRGIDGITGDSDDTPAAGRADAPPMQGVEVACCGGLRKALVHRGVPVGMRSSA